MFQRYTNETKRAIYFAAQLALFEQATVIDSTYLLRGLLTDAESRANNIFRLCQLFPEDAAKQSTLKNQQPNNQCELIIKHTSRRSVFQKKKVAPNPIGLGRDGKRILAYAAREANQLRDYWIETEHLVLGILRERENAAASKLLSTGLDLPFARECVIENGSSRLTRPNPVLWSARRRPLGGALAVAFFLGVIAALILLGSGGAK